ncbi:YjcZ family sporulation protein [Bacillus alkalicola]|uniref:YjcZ family sporulation protein n=1 Tax=Evansella alkalicola TaxID=745819 RepID=A0ABS6JQK1_9BACI|nr:YjcZ family sporulation protein [Bacillus alkalicola]MBU9720823.1 YjcZ family sporulation protein [Bacillus alkalicola]
MSHTHGKHNLASGFAFILVIFILLVIIGAAIV